ncbi:MAG: DUF1771 domain-containing protein [Oligoflexales bacterium]
MENMKGKSLISNIFKLITNLFRNKSKFQVDTKNSTKQRNQKVSRELANQFTAKRHECFQESQEAFKSGDKAKAFALSQEGKEWGMKLEEMNALVVKSILEPQQSIKTGIIDLHGLFVKEAEVAVRGFLDHHLGSQKKNFLEIITGAGNNSTIKNQPVIRPAIEKILRQRSLKYELLPGDGAYLVVLKEKDLPKAE